MEESQSIITNNKKENKSFLYKREYIPIFREGVMKQSISKKNDIRLDEKIENKKSIISNLFIQKFGPNFFNKYRFIDEFKTMFGKYLLDINGLNNNNYSIKDIILKRKKKKINKKELNTKINMGNMTFLNLRANIVSNKSLFNDKLFYLSKNFSISDTEKDIMTNINKRAKKNITLYNKNLSNLNKSKKYNQMLTTNNKEIINKKNSSEIIDNSDNKKKKKIIHGNSSSQKNIVLHKKFINLKKYLISNKNNKDKTFGNSSSNNQQYYETEKNNNNNLFSNPLLLYNNNISNKYQKKDENNTNSLSSISQTEVYNPKISNFILSKYNNFSLESEGKIKSPYITKNMSDSEISNNIINNYYKSLSTNETNGENKNNKKISTTINSAINLNTKINFKIFKTNIDNQTNLLNKYMNKCNKRLVKIIDGNLRKKIETNEVKIIKRKHNANLVKDLLDKKISKKILKKYNKSMKTIKPVLKMSQNDEKDLNKNKDKNADKNYFLNNYKNMDDNLALFYVGELYNTKNIKLQLKEIVEKRNELKNKIEKEKLLRIKQKLNTNSFTIRKIRFRIMRINEKNKEKYKS